MATVTGTFNTFAGLVTVAITDAVSGNATMEMVEIGDIVYEFDLTPDALSIDRIYAIYNAIDISVLLYDKTGADLYDRFTLTTETRTVLMTVNLHNGESGVFKFQFTPNEVRLDERSRIVTLKCLPFQPMTTIGDIFTGLSAGESFTFRFNSIDYTAISVGRFIQKALSEFTSETNIFDASLTNDLTMTPDLYEDFDNGDLVALNSLLCLVIVNLTTSGGFPDVTLSNGNVVNPEDVPAIELLKDLAAFEGSIIGVGWKNFYRYRDDTTTITLSYNDCIELRFEPRYQALQFITERIPYTGYSGQFPNFSQIDNIERTESLVLNASKNVVLSKYPAFPFLNKGLIDGIVNNRVDGDYTGFANKDIEQKIVDNGVAVYQKALPATGNFVIDAVIRGVDKIKPYDAITFDTSVPARYQGKTFRVSYLSYDFNNDLIKIKAYEL